MSKINRIVLITGCAGFIGAALAKRFLNDNFKVIGIDNINDYYDQNLKLSRLKDIKDLAVEDFDSLDEVIQSLWYQSRREKPSLFSRIKNALTFDSFKIDVTFSSVHEYLSQSRDRFDLEQRERKIMRGNRWGLA